MVAVRTAVKVGGKGHPILRRWFRRGMSRVAWVGLWEGKRDAGCEGTKAWCRGGRSVGGYIATVPLG